VEASTTYTDLLKKIKETEEGGSRELSDRKKDLEDELQRLEEAARKSISEAKEEAEAIVNRGVEGARNDVQAEVQKLLSSATGESEKLAAKKLNGKELRKIIEEIVLAEFKGN